MGNNPMPPPPGKGRPKGTPNRATTDARYAIANFVDGNVGRLQGWLDAIASGEVKNVDGTTSMLKDGPNPEKAFSLFQNIIEYHVPKLQRTELTGANGGDINVNNKYPNTGDWLAGIRGNNGTSEKP